MSNVNLTELFRTIKAVHMDGVKTFNIDEIPFGIMSSLLVTKEELEAFNMYHDIACTAGYIAAKIRHDKFNTYKELGVKIHLDELVDMAMELLTISTHSAQNQGLNLDAIYGKLDKPETVNKDVFKRVIRNVRNYYIAAYELSRNNTIAQFNEIEEELFK